MAIYIHIHTHRDIYDIYTCLPSSCECRSFQTTSDSPFAPLVSTARRMTPDDFIQDVCRDHRRCELPKNVPPDVVKLMEAGWQASPRSRPDFLTIVPVRDYL